MVSTAFVRGLDGRTLSIQFPSENVTGLELKLRISSLTSLPVYLQRITTSGRCLPDDSVLFADANHIFPSCSLWLPLVGGKGGFGSLLRGAATKAGQKKTSNYDACRDMSGRRLRHVNAEKKLKEWIAEGNERALEKAGEDFIKKLAKEKKQVEVEKVDLTFFREMTAEALDRVSEAVCAGLEESKRQMTSLGKRPAYEADVSDLSRRSKFFKILEIDEDDEDDDDEDDESDNDKNVDELERSN